MSKQLQHWTLKGCEGEPPSEYKDNAGDWVLKTEAHTEIDRLQAEVDAIKEVVKAYCDNINDLGKWNQEDWTSFTIDFVEHLNNE